MAKPNVRTFRRKSNISGNIKLYKNAALRKKEKWTFLLKALVDGKTSFRISETNPFTFNYERLPKSFALEWEEKQLLKAHYKVLRENNLKFLMKKAKRSSSLSDQADLDGIFPYDKAEFLCLLESRLDVCLWKVHFFRTLGEARQAIRCGLVLVEGKKVKNYGRLLEKGETVSLVWTKDLVEKKQKILRETLFFQNYGQFGPEVKEEKSKPQANKSSYKKLNKVLRYPKFKSEDHPYPLYWPPAHLEVSYASLQFVFVGKPDVEILEWPYNIYLNRIKF